MILEQKRLDAAWVKAVRYAVWHDRAAATAVVMFKYLTGRLPWDCDLANVPKKPGDWQRPAKEVFRGGKR